MQSFTIRTHGFEEIKKKILFRYLLILMVILTIGIGVGLANNHDTSGFNIWPYYILFLAVFLVFNISRNIKKLKNGFNSYRLTIGDDRVITREQSNLKSLSISAIEISGIQKNKNGSYKITGLTKADAIYVPAQIEKPDTLETELNKLHTITILTSTPPVQWFAPALLLAMLLSMLGVFLSTNKIVVAVSGIVLTGVMLYAFIELRRNKNIDERLKQRSWIFFIVLLAVLFNVIVKVFDVNSLEMLQKR